MLSKKDKTELTRKVSDGVPTNPEAITLFNQLFEADRNRLYSYIYAHVLNHAAADDIFQETSISLWQQFEKFEPGTSFSKWANAVAFYKVLSHSKKRKKYQLGLSDDFLKEFSENIAVMESNARAKEQKWQHLAQCRTALSDPLKMVYDNFYVNNLTAQDIATTSGKSIFAIRKAVRTLRKKLIDCVDKKVKGSAE